MVEHIVGWLVIHRKEWEHDYKPNKNSPTILPVVPVRLYLRPDDGPLWSTHRVAVPRPFRHSHGGEPFAIPSRPSQLVEDVHNFTPEGLCISLWPSAPPKTKNFAEESPPPHTHKLFTSPPRLYPREHPHRPHTRQRGPPRSVPLKNLS